MSEDEAFQEFQNDFLNNFKTLLTQLKNLNSPFIMCFNNDNAITVTYHNKDETLRIKTLQFDDRINNVFKTQLEIPEDRSISIVCNNKGYVFSTHNSSIENPSEILTNTLHQQKAMNEETKLKTNYWRQMASMPTLSRSQQGVTKHKFHFDDEINSEAATQGIGLICGPPKK